MRGEFKKTISAEAADGKPILIKAGVRLFHISQSASD